MAAVLGLNAKAYFQGDVASPGPYTAASTPAFADWTGEAVATPPSNLIEMTIVRDVTLNMELALADVSTRAGGAGFRQQVGTLADGTVETQMVWDTADNAFNYFADSYFARSAVNLFVSDQGIVAGSQGLWAPFVITNFTRNEELENALLMDVRFNVTTAANANPAWVELV